VRVVAAVVFALLTYAAPAAAEDFTGAEEQEMTLDCRYDGTAYPETQEAPGEGECVDRATQGTYQGLVWDNEVKCSERGFDVSPAGRLHINTTDDGLRVGMCNDSAEGPIQGRAVAQTSLRGGPLVADSASHAYIDGDGSNGQYHDALEGYARIDAASGGAALTCGDAAGRQDATVPSRGDGVGTCG
jgi:hypothetical protein